MSEGTTIKGTKADQTPGPFMHEKGEVTYVAAFPGTFVTHTEADARTNIDKFRMLGRTLALYRIEILEVFEPELTLEPEASQTPEHA